MHMGCSGDHPCACEQQVGKKRKNTGRKKTRKEYEVQKEKNGHERLLILLFEDSLRPP